VSNVQYPSTRWQDTYTQNVIVVLIFGKWSGYVVGGSKHGMEFVNVSEKRDDYACCSFVSFFVIVAVILPGHLLAEANYVFTYDIS
jgi:hypothetical protein